ncbi:glycerol-3-phosphate transporter [Agrilactobacillus composti DSM 18527 = JCM 14202]|uniref:hypothetical protein n=1 Tax=Agrilactobacillus composti TaxID=398555 RepID=UPI00042DE46E|nr:hypothetical protein [Agrilactobacillus composti]GAF40036.1 glycerol-3-phosphate transporter [Agrilactobacillus composti DSM 18527 = JCM 14202]
MQLLKPHIATEKVPQEKVDETYKKLRLQVFLGIFIGYAGYYLLRNNFSLAIPQLTQAGFSKGQLGLALSAVSLPMASVSLSWGWCLTTAMPAFSYR